MDDVLAKVLEAIRKESAEAHAETRRHFEKTLTEAQGETRRHFETTLAEAHAETHRHFDVAVERMDRRFDSLAEAVQLVDEKVDRKGASLELEIERTAADTQAMI